MDLSYSEEQLMLRESAKRLLAAEYTPNRLSGPVVGIWQRFAGMGWLALPLPEDCGGLAGGAVELGILMREFGAALVAEPYVSTVVLGGMSLTLAGDAAQRRHFLPGVAEGSLRLALAFGEDGRSYCEAPQTEAVRQADGWRLSGRKSLVLGAGTADYFVVPARVAAEVALFMVPAAAPGVTAEPYRLVDGSTASDIEFSSVLLEEDARLRQCGNAASVLSAVLDQAVVAMAAYIVGAMGYLVEATISYSRTRVQFGRPIGEFQVLQHRMADMAVALAQAEAITLYAALAIDSETSSQTRAVSAAKVKVARAARFVAEQAVQLHGAMGVTDELNIGAYLKRILVFEKIFGDAAEHRGRYAACLREAGAIRQGLVP